MDKENDSTLLWDVGIATHYQSKIIDSGFY
jgi:hypothetical protein